MVRRGSTLATTGEPRLPGAGRFRRRSTWCSRPQHGATSARCAPRHPISNQPGPQPAGPGPARRRTSSDSSSLPSASPRTQAASSYAAARASRSRRSASRLRRAPAWLGWGRWRRVPGCAQGSAAAQPLGRQGGRAVRGSCRPPATQGAPGRLLRLPLLALLSFLHLRPRGVGVRHCVGQQRGSERSRELPPPCSCAAPPS